MFSSGWSFSKIFQDFDTYDVWPITSRRTQNTFYDKWTVYWNEFTQCQCSDLCHEEVYSQCRHQWRKRQNEHKPPVNSLQITATEWPTSMATPRLVSAILRRHSGRKQANTQTRSISADWLLTCGLTSHSTQNRSFWRRFPKPIPWLGMEKKPGLEKTFKM